MSCAATENLICTYNSLKKKFKERCTC